MINLEEIKTPYHDDIHKMTKVKVMLPLPSRDGSIKRRSTIIDDEWYDQFDTKYRFKNGKLFISKPKELETLLQHIDRIRSNIEVVFDVNDIETFNSLCRALHRRPTNKNIDIAIATTCHFDKRRWLDFELLPDNVKVSNLYHNYCQDDLPGSNDFDWWGLWLSDEDFKCVRSRLTPMAKERFEKMRFIAQSFYENFSRKYGSSVSDKDKADFVFQWMRKEIPYAFETIGSDGSSIDGRDANIARDPIYTFEKKSGRCAGRARLMKTLLNNRFMRVNCFLTDGMCGSSQHEWNEIYFSDGTRGYYDLSFGVCNEPMLDSQYCNLDHSDAVRGYIAEDCSSFHIRPLPSRRRESERAVQKRKLPHENVPPLPPRRHE